MRARPRNPGSITEDELRKQFEGKDLFLRGGYLDNTLTFNEHGVLIGHSPQGSYTLAGIRIEKVRLLKHKVELDGRALRVALSGRAAFRGSHHSRGSGEHHAEEKNGANHHRSRTCRQAESRKRARENGRNGPRSQLSQRRLRRLHPRSIPPMGPAPNIEPTDAQEAQMEMAAAPEAERPADAKSVTATLSPAHANKVLEEALGNVFAQGFDERMMASMPGFWKLYYDAVAAKADYQPADSNVLRQNMVDKKARLKSTFEPGSNQFAQDYGVAGMSEYHVVVGADGKPVEIAVARPIGFGLDESAVDSIRKATFEPAVKDGKPVPVLLNLVVEFRIYSKRTEVASNPALEQASPRQLLPGPYSVQH